jgi:hypothetical protein
MGSEVLNTYYAVGSYSHPRNTGDLWLSAARLETEEEAQQYATSLLGLPDRFIVKITHEKLSHIPQQLNSNWV